MIIPRWTDRTDDTADRVTAARGAAHAPAVARHDFSGDRLVRRSRAATSANHAL